MTHDPYQTYPTFGAFSGLTNPFNSPYGAMQSSAINPAVAYNPLANAGIPWGSQAGIQQPYEGVSPQQLQLASALAAQQAAWQNPFAAGAFQHPFAGVQQNPFINAALQNPLLNPVLGQMAAQIYQQPYQQQFQQPSQQQFQPPSQHMGQGLGQQGVPFAQFNSPFGPSNFGPPTLAPQSWVGQGQGQPGQGQVHPLFLQSIARALQAQGVSPWGTY
jgi:hypothetical protein